MIEKLLWIAFFASLCGFVILLYDLNRNFTKIYEETYMSNFSKKWNICFAILFISLAVLHFVF